MSENNSTPSVSSLTSGVAGLCFVLGFASIIGSIAIWFFASKPDPAHGERFGIFVGLWAPTFFILSDRLSRRKA